MSVDTYRGDLTMITRYKNKGLDMTLSEIAREKFKRDKVLQVAITNANLMIKAGFTEEDLLPIYIKKD
jgi:uncharacterized protein YdaT